MEQHVRDGPVRLGPTQSIPGTGRTVRVQPLDPEGNPVGDPLVFEPRPVTPPTPCEYTPEEGCAYSRQYADASDCRPSCKLAHGAYTPPSMPGRYCAMAGPDECYRRLIGGPGCGDPAVCLGHPDDE